jgi:hypothetical protein
MTNYLEAAADILAKVVKNSATYTLDVECARVYALLAAVDKGLMPEAVAEEIYGQLRSKGGAR